MGPEYMIDLGKKLKLSGSICVFEIPKSAQSNHFSDVDVINSWKDDLFELCKEFSTPILLGHSLGGMLCLASPRLAEAAKAMVLVDTSPDISYKKSYDDEFKRIGTVEMDQLSTRFEQNPTEHNLMLLFTSWAPFFFMKPNIESNLMLLKLHSYNILSFAVGMRTFLSTYSVLWKKIEIPTLIVSGEFDRITPVELFEKYSIFNEIKRISVTKAGHFPWIENLHMFEKTLLNFESTIWV